MQSVLSVKDVIFLKEGAGRSYKLGAMQSIFKADGPETADGYSISEWWLEPHSLGPGAHSHEANDDIFYVLEGRVTFVVDGKPVEADAGAFVRVPAGLEHDYENSSDTRARFLNIYIPGGFEQEMPAIVRWFEGER